MAGTEPTSSAAQRGAETGASNGAANASTDAPDPLIAAHNSMHADHDLQFQFQNYVEPRPPDWLEPLLRFLQAIGPFLRVVFWIGVAAIVAFILFVIIREAARRWGFIDFSKKAKQETPNAPVFKPTASRARALLEEADRLAAEGRYSEAVRVLLHRSIEDIERAYPITIGPAATSREIARLEPLSQHGRVVFGRIAQAVETSLFGERPLDQTRFAECRAAYATFALGKAA